MMDQKEQVSIASSAILTKLASLDIKSPPEPQTQPQYNDSLSSSNNPNIKKKKLLILDVNGLLADVVNPAPRGCKPDAYVMRRAIFKRPFCDDFLNFCFENFDVGLWSSRTKKVLDAIIPCIIDDDLRRKLLLCLDSSVCTPSGFNTLENIDKPMVFKELRKIWELRTEYDESNTLLLDDTPYKALLNPVHTAVFPSSYSYQDNNDRSLGPGGDLRVYLEGLLEADDVRKYVETHPFGKKSIDENDKDWSFYSKAVGNVKKNRRW